MMFFRQLTMYMLLGILTAVLPRAHGQDLSEKIDCPQKITQMNAPGKCGAHVTYSDPFEAVGSENLTQIQNNTPPGSFFDCGEKTVYYKASDLVNTSYFCVFTVEVNDTERPKFIKPLEDISVISSGEKNVQVFWEEPQVIDNCSEVAIISDYHSGDLFPIGTTEVNYWATDNYGNLISTSFTVTVNDMPSSLANSQH